MIRSKNSHRRSPASDIISIAVDLIYDHRSKPGYFRAQFFEDIIRIRSTRKAFFDIWPGGSPKNFSPECGHVNHAERQSLGVPRHRRFFPNKFRWLTSSRDVHFSARATKGTAPGTIVPKAITPKRIISSLIWGYA